MKRTATPCFQYRYKSMDRKGRLHRDQPGGGMKKNYIFKAFVYPIVCIILYYVSGCSSSKNDDSEKKTLLSLESNGTKNFYDLLEDYPGLESLFTAGDMTILEFEDLLFGDFLGNVPTADTMIYVKDAFPKLINSGTSTAYIFSGEVAAEMESKGPVPDFLGAFSIFSEGIMALDEENKESLYKYFDQLVRLDAASGNDRRIFDYIVDLMNGFIGYLSTVEDEDINKLMHTLVVEFTRFKLPEEGKLDFVDVDKLIEKFTAKAPEGMVEVFEGLKLLLQDKEFKEVFTKILSALGKFLGDPKAFSEYKAFFLNLFDSYTSSSLGETIERMWDEGPIIGPEMESMGIERYGADGTMSYALQELLMHPEILNLGLETFYNFKKEGFGFEKSDDQLRTMMRRNPFCSDRKGEGEYGNGEFYEPNENVSYKNLSTFKALVALLSRWNVPFTFTCPFLYETKGAKGAKQFMRNMIPGADSLPASALIWTEIYEKAPDKYMGSGHPVDYKKGYGMMLNKKYVAPACPGILTPANVAMYIMGDSVHNGPHDNIYDNLRWMLYEREMFVTLDLVQISPHIPLLKGLASPVFNLLGIKELPITVLKMNGAIELLNLEVGQLIRDLPNAITLGMIQVGIPDIIVVPIVNVFKQILPVGDHLDKSSKVYLMPQDVREMSTLVYSLAYYDENAFHLDRLLDIRHPKNYKYFYDIRDYTFEKNADKANPLWNLMAPLCVASCIAFNEAVGTIPRSLEYVPERQKAARETLGMIFPLSYLNNMVGPFTEIPTENSIYDIPDNKIMPVFEYLEPLLLADEYGFFENFFDMMAVIGKPELKAAREKALWGLSKLVATIDKDTRSTYTLASELLRITGTAVEDNSRWDSFELFIEGWHKLLDTESGNEILTDFVDFVDYMIRVDMTDEDYKQAAESVIKVFEKGTGERILTRGLYHITTLFDEFDQSKNWDDTLDMLEHAIRPDGGVLSYVFKGLEKDPEMPWCQIVEDADKFLHSEIMKSYEEGSFWKDIYHLLDFLTEAIEEPNT